MLHAALKAAIYSHVTPRPCWSRPMPRSVMAGSFAPPVGSRPLTRMIARNRRSLCLHFAFLGGLQASQRPTDHPDLARAGRRDRSASRDRRRLLQGTFAGRPDRGRSIRPPPSAGRRRSSVRALAEDIAAGETLLTTRLVGPGLPARMPGIWWPMPLRVEDPAEVAFLRAR